MPKDKYRPPRLRYDNDKQRYYVDNYKKIEVNGKTRLEKYRHWLPQGIDKKEATKLVIKMKRKLPKQPAPKDQRPRKSSVKPRKPYNYQTALTYDKYLSFRNGLNTLSNAIIKPEISRKPNVLSDAEKKLFEEKIENLKVKLAEAKEATKEEKQASQKILSDRLKEFEEKLSDVSDSFINSKDDVRKLKKKLKEYKQAFETESLNRLEETKNALKEEITKLKDDQKNMSVNLAPAERDKIRRLVDDMVVNLRTEINDLRRNETDLENGISEIYKILDDRLEERERNILEEWGEPLSSPKLEEDRAIKDQGEPVSAQLEQLITGDLPLIEEQQLPPSRRPEKITMPDIYSEEDRAIKDQGDPLSNPEKDQEGNTQEGRDFKPENRKDELVSESETEANRSNQPQETTQLKPISEEVKIIPDDTDELTPGSESIGKFNPKSIEEFKKNFPHLSDRVGDNIPADINYDSASELIINRAFVRGLLPTDKTTRKKVFALMTFDPDILDMVDKIRRSKGRSAVIEYKFKQLLDDWRSKGLGRGADDKNYPGLYSDEIVKIMQDEDDFVGVIDESQIIDLPLQDIGGAIVNNGAEHWYALYWSRPEGYIGYIDSLCLKPTELALNNIKAFAKKLMPDHLMKLKISDVVTQRANGNNCGYYAIQVLKDLFDGKTFPSATNFKEYGIKLGDIVDEDGNKHSAIRTVERKIKELKEKVRKFELI